MKFNKYIARDNYNYPNDWNPKYTDIISSDFIGAIYNKWYDIKTSSKEELNIVLFLLKKYKSNLKNDNDYYHSIIRTLINRIINIL